MPEFMDKPTSNQIISNVISAKYSLHEQIALIRQQDARPDEFRKFYEFAENVKQKVREEYGEEAEESTTPPATTLTELDGQITDTQMAVVESYEYADEQNTNTQIAMVEVYEHLLSLEERLAALEGGNANG